MATASEKETLNLPATASDADVMARITALASHVCAQGDVAGDDGSMVAIAAALELPLVASEAEVLERIASLRASADTAGTPTSATTSDSGEHILIYSKSGNEFRRGRFVISPTAAIVLHPDSIDPSDLAALKGDARVGIRRTSEPVTPENEIQRYTR